ncbi:MAG: hypothetical protein ABEJ65_10145 [bacterium]
MKPEDTDPLDQINTDDSSFDFSSDQAARESMKNFIRENFGELLGDKIELLDEPNGFSKIQEAFREEIDEAGKNVGKNVRKLMSLLGRMGNAEE